MNRNNKKRIFPITDISYGVICAIGLSTLLLTGCGGNAISHSDSAYFQDNNISVGTASEDSFSDSLFRSSFASDKSDTQADRAELKNNSDYGSDESGNSTIENNQAQSPADEKDVSALRKLIRTVSFTAELESSKEIEKIMDQTVTFVKKYDGYTESQYRDTGSYSSYGTLTVRIPQERVDDFLQDARSQEGVTITNYQDNIDDVSLQYYDVESRLDSSRAAKQRYMDMLNKADEVGDILSIQQRIDEIIANEESYQRQITSMDSSINYTSISIRYECKVNQEQPGFIARFTKAFRSLMYDIGDTLIDALSWFVNAIIWLVFIIPVIVLVIRAFMFAINSGGKKKEKTKPRKDGRGVFTAADVPDKVVSSSKTDGKVDEK